MRLLVAAVVRSMAFAVVFLVARFVPTPDDVVGVNIGLGLAVFALYAIGAAALSIADALVHPLRWVAAVWAVTAVLVGVAQPFLALSEWGPGRSVIWSDLTELSPFVACLVAVPAMVAGTLTSAWVRGQSEQTSASDRSTAPSDTEIA